MVKKDGRGESQWKSRRGRTIGKQRWKKGVEDDGDDTDASSHDDADQRCSTLTKTTMTTKAKMKTKK